MQKPKWIYSGDVNIEYGGTYFDLTDWQYGYVSAVRITDMDSACGEENTLLIEHIVINGTDDKKRIINGLQCVGLTPRDLLSTKGHIGKKLAIADALMSYGYFDTDDGWNHYTQPYSVAIIVGLGSEEFKKRFGMTIAQFNDETDPRFNGRTKYVALPQRANVRRWIERNHLD